MDEAEEKKPFPCTRCNRSFTCDGDLKRHFRFHGYEDHVCDACNKRFSCDYDLRQHSITHHGKADDVHKGAPAGDPNLKTYVRVEAAPQPRVPCEKCNRSFACESDLERHLRFHGGDEHACDACKKKFACDYDLQRHLLVHHSEQKHKVPVEEGAPPGGDPNLGTYLRHDDATQLHVCSVCKEAVPRGFRLVRHLRKHAAENEKKKPLLCNVCHLAFSTKACLRRHTLVHTGERPCVCRECGAAFSQDSSLKTHMRSAHTGERPHRCGVCGKGFTRGPKLRVHFRIHTGEKPHACAMCSARFNNSSALRCHLRTHTGEKPFSCDTCSKGFSSLTGFKLHTRRSLCKQEAA